MGYAYQNDNIEFDKKDWDMVVKIPQVTKGACKAAESICNCKTYTFSFFSYVYATAGSSEPIYMSIYDASYFHNRFLYYFLPYSDKQWHVISITLSTYQGRHG